MRAEHKEATSALVITNLAPLHVRYARHVIAGPYQRPRQRDAPEHWRQWCARSRSEISCHSSCISSKFGLDLQPNVITLGRLLRRAMEAWGFQLEVTVLDTSAFELSGVFPIKIYRAVLGPGRQFESTSSCCTKYMCYEQ